VFDCDLQNAIIFNLFICEQTRSPWYKRTHSA